MELHGEDVKRQTCDAAVVMVLPFVLVTDTRDYPCAGISSIIVGMHSSVCDIVDKGDRESSSPRRVALYVSKPPLMVLLPIHHNHLAL